MSMPARSHSAYLTLFGAVLLTAGMGSALAASVHFKQNRNPTFTDQGLTLNAVGALVGLGNADLLVGMLATANATATCTNPGTGQTQPPGQNPAPVAVSGSEAIPASEIKNGTTPFDVTTEPPETPILGAPGCPNSKWVETITDLSFTSATLTFTQSGSTVFSATCSFNPATSNGTVPTSTVTCH
jgi:hypothetical protein